MDKRAHFIGLLGRGMIGLAQMFRWAGWDVTGSDSSSSRPWEKQTVEKLVAQGIRIFPQDCSFAKEGLPELIVYSTAIKPDHPEMLADV